MEQITEDSLFERLINLELEKMATAESFKELKKEDEDAIAAEPDKTKPEDDAYLSETGRILLDYLKLNTAVAKH